MKTRAHTLFRLSRCCAPILLVLAHSPLAAVTIETAKWDRASVKIMKSSEVFAVWYQVPTNSLARRRAKLGEFTAAHNRLPLGTLVRVTRVSNGRSVVVRITDRGITNRRASIDLCREAAEKLGMIREGLTRVRLEVVSEEMYPAMADPNQLGAH